MSFNWINWVNMAAVVWLIFINVIAARKGLSDSFNSKHLIVNIFEQIGRYGCMALLVFGVPGVSPLKIAGLQERLTGYIRVLAPEAEITSQVI